MRHKNPARNQEAYQLHKEHRGSADNVPLPVGLDTLGIVGILEGVCTLCNSYYTIIRCVILSIPLSDVVSSCLCSVGGRGACSQHREISQLGEFCLSWQNLRNRLTNICGGGLEYSTVIWRIIFVFVGLIRMFVQLFTCILHGGTKLAMVFTSNRE